MTRIKTFLTISLLLFAGLISSAQQNPLWLRYPAISPDGNTILFNYKGDIYKVDAEGGIATPLTLSDSYEFAAVWSHDGKSIAFSSDRYGNFDIFVMPVSGGEARRLTYHSNNEQATSFTRDNKSIIFSGLRQDLHTDVQFPSGVLEELYSVPVNGGKVQQVLTSPAYDAVFSNDGKKLIFHDRKGYENIWRKHHKSSIARDIWTYDFETEEFNMITDFDGEDRNPVFAANDNDFYYLSEESGSFNVIKSNINKPDTKTAITEFENHPVRFLSSSDNDILCFSYHGEIYTMTEGGEPEKVPLSVNFDGRETLSKTVAVNNGFTEASLSPNGKEFAYIFRGEIFVSSIDNGDTKRITNTPWQERSVSFSPDGRSLLYAAERDNSWNIYSKTISRDEEPYFYLSTILNEKTILATDQEEFQPSYSPDGKEVAYLENRTTLKVINLASGQTRTILPGKHNYSYSDGDQWYQWSPDSKWFIVEFGQQERIMTGEVGLIEASGNGTLRNLSQSGYSDSRPVWSSDGKMITWASDREAAKSENDRSVARDVYAMFFTQEAFDRFNLSKDELELLKEKEKKEKETGKDAPETNSKKKNKTTVSEENKDEIEDLVFDWENMEYRKERFTVHTSSLSDWVLSKDCEKLYYITRFEGRNDLWVTDLREKDSKIFTKLGAGRASMMLSKDGDFILVLADGRVSKVDLKDGKSKAVRTNGEMILRQDLEREYIFDHSWRQVREKFYVPDLQGVNWDFYYDEYKVFLPYINNSYDFAEMLSEMLGELNASHTGGSYRHRDQSGDITASLGLLYDYNYSGEGQKIAEVLIGGPADRAALNISKGNIIEKIDGIKITGDFDFYKLLNRKTGKNLLLSLSDPATGKKWEEVIKPISMGAENQLLYKRWVESRRDEVVRLSGGKLGYVHVRGMNDASMRVVYEEALGKHFAAEGLVVDTRFNGGGNLHEQLSDFLLGKKYMEIIPHGQLVGFQPGNKWLKPSVVVMGESNYSDAHLFPEAYKIKGGKLTIGMPVPGTGTFVWWENQIDPTIRFGIPMGGWRPLGRPFLENNQMEPDILVKNEPGAMAKGRDQQIEAAVQELLKK